MLMGRCGEFGDVFSAEFCFCFVVIFVGGGFLV
jgi:hypothetical protein